MQLPSLHRAAGFGLLLLAAAWQTSGIRLAVTPVEKVIELLKKLENQVAEEGKDEAAQYDKFACFCKDQADSKQHAIERSKEKEASLAATIKELDASVADLEAAVEKLKTKIKDLDTELKEITAKREEEEEKTQKEVKDLADAIEACKAAIEALQASKEEMKASGAKVDLLQAGLAAAQARVGRNPSGPRSSAVVALLGASDTPAAVALLQQLPKGDPGRAGYESTATNKIIDLIRELLQEFRKEKKDVDDKAFQQKTAFDKKKLSLTNEKKFAEKEVTEKEELIEEQKEESAAAKKDKDAEETARKADEGFLEELTETCETKAAEWDKRSKTRAMEMSAIAEAIEILKEGVQPNYGANKAMAGVQQHASLDAGGQQRDPPSFLQLHAAGRGAAVRRARMALGRAASRLGSRSLAALVAALGAEDDKFAKVKQMIQDLIKNLQEEAAAEKKTKAFCDENMKKTMETRDKAEADMEEAGAEIVKKKVEASKLGDEIETLADEQAESRKGLNEATELRATEKAANAKTLADAKAGKAAVEQAIDVLKKFYEANALLQRGTSGAGPDRDGKTVKDLAPETFKDEYKGKQDESKGIIGLLEVILSDFDRTLQNTESAEGDAQSEFEKYESETKADIEAKAKETKTKEGEVSKLKDEINGEEDKLTAAKRDLATSSKEIQKLKLMCTFGQDTYEERKKRREEEIQALKEALQILEDWKSTSIYTLSQAL